MKEISIIYDGEDFRMVISETKPKSESMELPDGKKI
jgi:hypothetical protein